MILNFEKIILHNFGSYGHTELSFNDKGFCLVVGKNHYKKDNALSNGSGKSFIWNGISFALTGETLAGVRSGLKNLNVDEDLSYVSLFFKNGATDYTLTRYIAPKTDLKIIENGVDVSGKGIRESEKKLSELLPDLTKDLIASSIIIGQGMPNKFSSFSPSGRKDLLEKLTKSDYMIEDIKNRVAVRQLELANALRALEDSLLVNKTNLTAAQNGIKKAKEELGKITSPDYDKEIKASETLCESIKKDIDKINAEKTEAFKKYDAANKSLVEKTKEQQAEFSEELEAYTTAISDATLKKNTLDIQIQNTKREISRLKNIKDVCPTCGQKIPGAVKPDTSGLEKEVEENEKLLKSAKDKISDINTNHTKYRNKITEDYKQALNDLQKTANDNKRDYDRLQDTSNDLSHNLNVEKERLTNLKNERDNLDKYIAGLNKNIADFEQQEKDLNKAIKDADIEVLKISERQAIIRKMDTLIKRDFRGFLLGNIISYLNMKAKEYSNIVFGTEDIEIKLSGNAIDISYNNKIIDCLSGGEQMRVDLILQLAIRDLLSKYFNFSSNIIVLDEITDFLDSKSCEAVMELLSTVLRDVESVFIISHHSDELPIIIDNNIQVTKDENGISTIA